MQDTFRVSNKNLAKLRLFEAPDIFFLMPAATMLISDRFSNFVSTPVFSH